MEPPTFHISHQSTEDRQIKWLRKILKETVVNNNGFKLAILIKQKWHSVVGKNDKLWVLVSINVTKFIYLFSCALYFV
jgi:hypothetical protein